MYSAYFNNLNSYYDLGLKIIRRPIIPFPERNINIIEVEGRNGSLIEDIGTYRDIEIPVSFNFISMDNINEKCRVIKNWLANIKDKKLVFSDDTGFFYMVKYIKTDNIERSLKVLGRFTVIFICDPFHYISSADITIDKASTIYNPGTFYAQPVMTVYGAGDITLTINNSNVILKGIQDYITINSLLQDAYRDTLSLNNKMAGEFPVFNPGENSISWLGNITKIKITPNWRCL